MKKITLIALVSALLFGLIACAQPVAGNVVQSDKSRETSPAASRADLAALAEANTSFAFDLYQTLRSTDGNLFYSPYPSLWRLR